MVMYCCKGSEQRAEVDAHVCYAHVSKVGAKVGMTKVWKDGYDLIIRTEGGD